MAKYLRLTSWEEAKAAHAADALLVNWFTGQPSNTWRSASAFSIEGLYWPFKENWKQFAIAVEDETDG